MNQSLKRKKRIIRRKRTRAKISGTVKIPRLCVFKSLNHIYAQLIDDEKGETILSASDLEIKSKNYKRQTAKSGSSSAGGERDNKTAKKMKAAYEVGKLTALKAKGKKISKIVFDRGGYKYHGRIKSLAQGARDGGLKF